MEFSDSVLDLEQLRLSVYEQNVEAAIEEVHRWIEDHGMNLLRDNQRLPHNFKEANDIRSQHEKVELKCMKFLSFYVQMNLRGIPDHYKRLSEQMDIAIHQFSQQIKARRHVVVAMYTFYRHMEALEKDIKIGETEDIKTIPNNVDEMKTFISKYQKDGESLLRKLSNLIDEGDRIKLALESYINLDSESPYKYIDKDNIDEAARHIDYVLERIKPPVTRLFESKNLTELELNIELRMVTMEEEIRRSIDWINILKQRIIDKYHEKSIGAATSENETLENENTEVAEKMKKAHDYGNNIFSFYKQLCDQIERDVDVGLQHAKEMEKSWKNAKEIISESSQRLGAGGELFLNLDVILNRVEDLLLAINKDRNDQMSQNSLADKYNPLIVEVRTEFDSSKKLAKNICAKIQCDLYNQKLAQKNQAYLVVEEILAMVNMKLFTLAVKIKELERCISSDDMLNYEVVEKRVEVPKQAVMPDGDDYDFDVEKFLKFLDSTRLNWESKALPKNLLSARQCIEEHDTLKNKCDQYWNNVRKLLMPFVNNEKKAKDAYQNAEKQKQNWDKQWRLHLSDRLNPRYEFLEQLNDFEIDLDKNVALLNEFLNRPNTSIGVVKDVNDNLKAMRKDFPKKEKEFSQLNKVETAHHKPDLDPLIQHLNDKLARYLNLLIQFSELQKMVEEISEFLPELDQFKESWNERVMTYENDNKAMNKLVGEANTIRKKVASYDTGKLQNLASKTYGNPKKVQWIVDKLLAEFVVPVRQKATTQEMQYSSANRTLITNTVTAEERESVDLVFDFNKLPKLNGDQYDLIVYKNDEIIDPEKNQRIGLELDSQNKIPIMTIEDARISDSGSYRCDLVDGSSQPVATSTVVLEVSTASVDPQFGDMIYVASNEPISLKTNLKGYNSPPNAILLHNDKPINFSSPDNSWIKKTSKNVIEFSKPVTTASDNGQYVIQIPNKPVITTQVEVGEPPKLLNQYFTKTVRPGENATLTVEVTNLDKKCKHTIVWKKDGKPLPNDVNVFQPFLNTNNEPSLEIYKFKPSYAGVYKCEIANEFGRRTAEIRLEVEKPGAQSPKSPPKFILPLQKEMTIITGSKIVLRCKIHGNPIPVIKWKRNGTEIKNEFKTSKTGEMHELIIEKAKLVDAGEFSVTASNNQGTEISRCNLKVTDSKEPQIIIAKLTGSSYTQPKIDDFEYTSDIDSPTNQRTQLVFSNTVVRSPPQFVSTFTDEIVPEGESVVLRCCLIGEPEPITWWSYNTHQMNNPKCEIIKEKDEYLLVMRDLAEEDSGRYSITAENSCGLATCSALVIVKKNQSRSNSVDRTIYPTKSKPIDGANFRCHTPLSQTHKPGLTDESRYMVASPQMLSSKSAPSTPLFNRK